MMFSWSYNLWMNKKKIKLNDLLRLAVDASQTVSSIAVHFFLSLTIGK